MEKLDFKKEVKYLYKPSAKKIGGVEVPKMNFLMVDGEGDPNTLQSFQGAIDMKYEKRHRRLKPDINPIADNIRRMQLFSRYPADV
ncbi:MAG: hypothetical protein L3J98_01480 [Gammaproteobacteria bacterium]|nr:hypothetical protein [Gammaproteobacteria bacterium]MCF6258827.1 hypothetical protein [Gammaproteobacteria bacterium]